MSYFITLCCLLAAAYIAYRSLSTKGGDIDRPCKKAEKLHEEPWLSTILRGQKLVGVEESLFVNGTYRLRGRVDRLYQLDNGNHVVVERKKRPKGRIYSTDTVQLSLYAYMLEEMGVKVAPFGFVSFPGMPAHMVQLLDRHAVESKLEKYAKLQSGKLSPWRADGNKCRNCSHTSICTK